MATEEEKVVSSFPLPPAVFYKHYSDENVEKGLAPKPPAPVRGAYQAFGAPFNTEDAMVRTLEEQGIQRLYPEGYDPKAELKKLNRSILICFLELLDILIANPASPARNQKIEDLRCLFFNVHHLINEYRPHQARETLRVIMERQKKQREEMIVQVQKATEQARLIVRECGEQLSQAAATVAGSRGLAAPQEGRGGGGGGAADEMMETNSSNSTEIAGRSEVKDGLVAEEDSQLCGLVDSLVARTKS